MAIFSLSFCNVSAQLKHTHVELALFAVSCISNCGMLSQHHTRQFDVVLCLLQERIVLLPRPLYNNKDMYVCC